MNSMSKGHYQDEKECGCKKEKEEGTKVLLKCKTGNPTTVAVTATATDYPAVASLIVNTSHFKDSCINLEFASNMAASVAASGVTGAAPLTVNFQTYKQCKGEVTASKIGPIWVYARPLQAVAFTSTDTFTFVVCDCDCDCDSCQDECCTYTVVASTPAVVGATGITTANINNPILSAIVVERSSRC